MDEALARQAYNAHIFKLNSNILKLNSNSLPTWDELLKKIKTFGFITSIPFLNLKIDWTPKMTYIAATNKDAQDIASVFYENSWERLTKF